MTAERIPTNRGNVPLRKWWKTTKVDVPELCKRAGIGFGHFKHVAAGRRAMSPLVAKVFIAASEGKLELDQLVYVPGNAPKRPRTKGPKSARA